VARASVLEAFPGGTLWPGNASVSLQKSWRKGLGRGKSGHLCLDIFFS